MNYLFNFMRVWALSLFGLLGPLHAPEVLRDYVGVNDAIVVVNNLTSAPWTYTELQIRKDPLGSFVDLGCHQWPRTQIYGYWYLQDLHPATTYEVRVRACDQPTGRFSDWVAISFTTWP